MRCVCFRTFFFFYNATATTEIYTLSLHDALPISAAMQRDNPSTGTIALLVTGANIAPDVLASARDGTVDRKSTRLNSSHSSISYAVFCLKKKKRNRK